MTTTTTTTTSARAGFSSVMRSGASSKGNRRMGFSPSRSGTKSTFLSSSSAFTSSSFGRRKYDKNGSRRDRSESVIVRADAFNNLSSTLDQAWAKMKGVADLSPENIKAPLKDVRRALLEADVSLPVVRRFIKRVEERAPGVKVTKGVEPSQELVKLVADELWGWG